MIHNKSAKKFTRAIAWRGLWIFLFTVSTLWACTAASAMALGYAQNFLANGGFEAGTAPTTPGWARSFWILEKPGPTLPAVDQCLSRSSDQSHSGNWSLKVDTGSVLDKEIGLMFIGDVDLAATKVWSGKLVLSGWVYVKPGTAVRPISLRLRTFGVNPQADGFTGDVLSTSIFGAVGRWVHFSAVGTIPKAVITEMDLQCMIRPDNVPTVQYLDDLKVEAVVPPAFEVVPHGHAFWRDRSAIPVDVHLSTWRAQSSGATTPATGLHAKLIPPQGTINVRLVGPPGIPVATWRLPGHDGIQSLPLPKKLLPEGDYQIVSTWNHPGSDPLTSQARIELSASPWEGAPRDFPVIKSAAAALVLSKAFAVEGTVAPTDLPDAPPEDDRPDAENGMSAQLDAAGIMGFEVFAPPALDTISRGRRPLPGEESMVRCFGCPGQYLSSALAVRAAQTLAGVSLQVGDFCDSAGHPAAIDTDVRVVRTIRLLPPFLERRAAVQIPAGQTQTFWITAHVGSRVRPGFYEGVIRVAATEKKTIVLPMLIRVLPLTLPPPEKGYGFWWGMDARWNGYYSKDPAEASEQVRKQFVLLHEYGCNMVSLGSIPKFSQGPDGKLDFDFNQDLFGYQFPLGEAYRLGRETGFFSAKVPLQYVGADSLATYGDTYAKVDRSSAAFDNFYKLVCRRTSDWAKEQGYPLAFACVDEIGNSPERRRDALRFYDLATQAGVLTSVTDNSPGGGIILTAQPRYSRIAKLRLFDFLWPEVIRLTRETGGIPWAYNLGSNGWNPAEDRLAFGLFTDRIGAEGHAQWAFAYPEGNTSPYEAAAAGKPTGYHYALPAPDGPLPTVALEAVREGIDDARYRALAMQLAPGSPTLSLKEIPPYSFRMDEFLQTHSPQWFDIERWHFARAAMK